jgi:hypothetical protein
LSGVKMLILLMLLGLSDNPPLGTIFNTTQDKTANTCLPCEKCDVPESGLVERKKADRSSRRGDGCQVTGTLRCGTNFRPAARPAL